MMLKVSQLHGFNVGNRGPTYYNRIDNTDTNGIALTINADVNLAVPLNTDAYITLVGSGGGSDGCTGACSGHNVAGGDGGSYIGVKLRITGYTNLNKPSGSVGAGGPYGIYGGCPTNSTVLGGNGKDSTLNYVFDIVPNGGVLYSYTIGRTSGTHYGGAATINVTIKPSNLVYFQLWYSSLGGTGCISSSGMPCQGNPSSLMQGSLGGGGGSFKDIFGVPAGVGADMDFSCHSGFTRGQLGNGGAVILRY